GGQRGEDARRLARSAAAGEILLGRHAHWLVRDSVAVEPERAGSDGATIYRAVALTGESERRALRLDSPLVGRERELDALATAFSNVVRSRACHVLTVVGAAGVGRSRLL